MGELGNFLLLFVGIVLLLAGVAGLIGFHDVDYHYDYQRSADEPPPRQSVEYYTVLTDEQKRMVDAAIAGEQRTWVFQSSEPIPQTEVIRKGDTYYVFDAYTTFDWTDRRTFVPALIALFGLALDIIAIRRDIDASDTVR